MPVRRGPLLALACSALGCSGDELPQPVPAAACAGHEVLVAGACVATGVEACASGFEADGAQGCVPILPAERCPRGTMAVPGDTACREVAPCGAAPWGDAPDEPARQHVDASFGGPSDGSAAAPWRTIGEATASAPAGGLVVVAEGTYDEVILLSGKPLRIWGRCPALVELVAPGGAFAAIDVRSGADGSLVHGMTVRSTGYGAAMSGSLDVTLEALWIDGTGLAGVLTANDLGPARLVVRGALIEGVRDAGIIAAGAELLVEASVIRGTIPHPNPASFGLGRGVAALDSTNGGRALATVTGSVIEDNHTLGAFAGGSDLVVEASVIRGTLPDADDRGGVGVAAQRSVLGPRASLRLAASVISDNHDTGVLGLAADLDIDGTVIERTQPSPQNPRYALGVLAESDPMSGERSMLHVAGSLVRDNAQGGIVLVSSDATIDGLAFRGTQPPEIQPFGVAIGISPPAPGGARSTLALTASRIDRARNAGLVIIESDATITAVVVAGTAPSGADLYGDGIGCVASTCLVDASFIQESNRAGIASFGAAVTLRDTALECNLIELDGEVFLGKDPVFDDAGGNHCGCGGTEEVCNAVSSALAPPDPFGGG